MIPLSNCLECNKCLWDEIPITQPKKGDLCVCIFCGYPMEFDKYLKLIRCSNLTDEIKIMSAVINFLNLNNANPFRGDPDKYNIKNKIIPYH